jgi:SAM-dependent methyltransferase
MSRYRREWFLARKQRARESADVVLPIVFSFVQPSSIVDVGCGTGSWIKAAEELGVTDAIGIDAPHVERTLLEFSQDSFIAHDLSVALRLDRTFDVALCLEVGEHLPRGSASVLVETLVRLAPVVLFSAAVPGQGGTSHTNEQWPEYWAKIFARHDYLAYDVVRSQIWRDDRVRYFYAQNALLYVRAAAAPSYTRLPAPTSGPPLSIVHPKLFRRVRETFPPPDSVSLGALLRFAGRLFLRPIQKQPTALAREE